MIQINENYRINGTATDYIAERKARTPKGEAKEVSWQLVGYYDSIEHAVKAIIDEEYRFRLREGEYDLVGALEEFRKVHEEFSKLLRRATMPDFRR